MSKKPNLLVIFTDQQNRWTLGTYGGTLVETPHLDRLAEGGVRFDNFMANSAVCTPSRGCFMTGRYPHCHGAYHNDIELNRDEQTLARVLQGAGHVTGYVGKWHLDGNPGWIKPERAMGFQHTRYMSEFGFPKGVLEDEDGNVRFDKDVNKGRYSTDWLTDKALDFLNMGHENPFFLMVNYPDPHTPFTVRTPYSEMYDPADMPIPATFRQEGLPSWAIDPEEGCGSAHRGDDPEGELRKSKAMYCGMVKCIDDNIGRMLDCLREKGVLDSTIVVFTTDHGEYMGEHGIYGKNLLFETVYRIPMLIHWPDGIRPGTVVDRIVDSIDFQQTILGLMGIEPSGREQGADASPLIRGEDADWTDEAYVHHSHFWFSGIFTPEYELGLHNSGEHILFDRRNDPDQTTNLIDSPEHEEVVKDLTARVVGHNRELESPACEWLDKLPFPE